MTYAWEDIGNRKPETYAEALARSEACLNPPRNEQDDADAIAHKREMHRRHEAYFAPAFFQPSELVCISFELARKLGHVVNEARFDDEYTGEGWPE